MKGEIKKMKVIDSNVSILDQEPGIVGMMKHVERVARVSYKSEGKISEDSYKSFLNMLEKRGHWGPFELGTVYLKIPIYKLGLIFKLLVTYPYTRIKISNFNAYITTNYRVIKQKKLETEMYKYWIEPTKYHKIRVTTNWICSRVIGNELVRHRRFSFMQESTRYCAYQSEKFGSEFTYIIPQWVYKLRDEIGNTIDSLSGESMEWILSKSGYELWKDLCGLDRTVSSRNRFWLFSEEEYLWETKTEESYKLKSEDARGVIPLDLKTEIYMCGYLDDWEYKPKNDSTERAGFFFLRSDDSAHPDIRVLSKKLENKFYEKFYK